MVQHMEKLALQMCFSLFPSVVLRNLLMTLSLLLSWKLWNELFLTRRPRGKWKPRPHQLHQEEERIVQHLLPPPQLFVSASVSLYSLWLALDCGRSDHDHAVLQRVVAPPPGLPKDALLPLVPLLGRRTLEVSTVEVGATTVAKPPAT